MIVCTVFIPYAQIHIARFHHILKSLMAVGVRTKGFAWNASTAICLSARRFGPLGAESRAALRWPCAIKAILHAFLCTSTFANQGNKLDYSLECSST
jgi:hypothetical protein